MKKIIFLGFNHFYKHKRGVENVIAFQADVFGDIAYYIHWDNCNSIYRYKNLICFSINASSWLKYLYLNLLVFKLVRKQRPGKLFIHSHNTLMSLFLYKRSDLFTVHDGLYYQKGVVGISGWKLNCFYILEKILYIRCKAVHFVSEFAKQNSLFISSSKCNQIIYNSCNYEKNVTVFMNDPVLFSGKYPFLLNQSYCFIVRSIEERARIDLVIEIARCRKELLFVIGGKGPLLEKYRKQVQEERVMNVFFLGFIPDDELFLFYANADFVMIPAEYGEGFGLPVIEGYLFGKPVIASRKCAIPEVIIDPGFLFENNVDSVGQAINRLSGLRNKFDYPDYYKRRFSADVIRAMYLKYYRQCMDLP